MPTLKDSVRYSVPAGTQSGTTFRLREQGVPRLHNQGRGDMLVTVTIDVPKKLTEEQKHLLEQFAATQNGGKAKPGKKGIFSKLREDAEK